MDYRGQKLAEYIYSIIVILFGAVAWIVGYVQNDFVVTFYGWAAGLAISLVVRSFDFLKFLQTLIFLVLSPYSLI